MRNTNITGAVTRYIINIWGITSSYALTLLRKLPYTVESVEFNAVWASKLCQIAEFVGFCRLGLK